MPATTAPAMGANANPQFIVFPLLDEEARDVEQRHPRNRAARNRERHARGLDVLSDELRDLPGDLEDRTRPDRKEKHREDG